MSVVCPNCASPDTLSLSLIHREGVPGADVHLNKLAAPPSKRNVIGWMIVVAICALLFVLSIRHPAYSTLVYASGGLAGLLIARSNRAFNTTRFPQLYSRWQLSFKCSRCGAVFLAS